MQAEFSVELAAGDPTLELPWHSPDPAVRYFDLKRDPGLLASVPEAAANPALRACLAALNASSSLFETAKCDAWLSTQMDVDDEPFGAPVKFCSYIDLLLVGPDSRFSFDFHEQFAGQAVKLLGRAPEIPASADLVIRRAYFHEQAAPDAAVRDGFYFTLYCSGYGDDEAHARRSWAIALDLVQNALLQLGSELDR